MRKGERKAKNPISLSAPSAIFPLVASSSKSNRLMALVKSIRKFSTPASTSFLCSGRSMQFCCRYFARISTNLSAKEGAPETDSSDVPTSGISRSLAEILRELNKKVPDSLVKVRMEDGFAMKYIPWHIVNRIMNSHAPEWSGEVRSITYSPDGKSVSVVYRVTLYGTDAEIYRESSGTASVDDTSYGDPVQKAEAMAFRRACARLGLGLHLYHEDMS